MEEVSALSTAKTHKLQLEEMHGTVCQVNGDLPYEVLQEGEEAYDGLDDELYELILSRQRDVSDRARAIAIFYDCVDMVQRIKDKFSDLLARRYVCGLPSSEIQIASTPPTSVAISTTTLTSPITAMLDSTSSSVTSSPVVLPKMTSMTAVSPSAVARSLSAVSSVQPWGLLEQSAVARGQEEGLPSWVDCADRLCLDALTGHGGRGPEEGRGLCAEIVERFHKADDDNTVVGLTGCDLAANDVVTNDDARCDGNNNNNNVNYVACSNEICDDIKQGEDTRCDGNNNNNKANYIACNDDICDDIKQGEDTGREVSAIRLRFPSRSSFAILLLCAVGFGWGQGRDGWAIEKCVVQGEGVGFWGKGWGREGVG
ncbi:hypothetical protein CBR_g8057 [Chara braunii]|uniref:Uncharacterized protein n=1 Tax=Chara braunii TaxID=69332 RepID=A0A388KL22_CHABU|nr:hypothetical protein CBR_g8057 [Chara braunii]|eukprot:GBG70759.1 hypothetical protein CBR_g8057 [Chara braunii]